MTKTKLWHLVLLVGGILAVLAPDLASAATVLSGLEVPWLKWPIRVLGMAALAGSRWDKIREKLEKLRPSSNTPVVCLLAMGSLLLAGSAQALAKGPQALGCLDAANTYCVVPAAAVGWQVNLKTGGTANAVSLVGLTLQHTFGSLPVGMGIYAGIGASAANQGSYQGCIGASVTSWGLVCGGAQRLAGESVWQGMITFAPQLTFGGTPSYVRGQ